MTADKSLPLECNLDWLHAISFTKGMFNPRIFILIAHFCLALAFVACWCGVVWCRLLSWARADRKDALSRSRS